MQLLNMVTCNHLHVSCLYLLMLLCMQKRTILCRLHTCKRFCSFIFLLSSCYFNYGDVPVVIYFTCPSCNVFFDCYFLLLVLFPDCKFNLYLTNHPLTIGFKIICWLLWVSSRYLADTLLGVVSSVCSVSAAIIHLKYLNISC